MQVSATCSERECPLHNFYGMTANPDILYTVTIFTGTDENVARTFDLHALEDVNVLFWPCYSVSHHPSRRASCGRPSSGVFAGGEDSS